MPKCDNCSKRGLFLKLNSLGLCAECEEKRLKEIDRMRKEKTVKDLNMKKEVFVCAKKFEVDLAKEEGRKLFAAWQLIVRFGMPSIAEEDLHYEARKMLKKIREEGKILHPYHSSYMAAIYLCEECGESVLSHLITYQAYKYMPATYRSKAIIEMEKAFALGHSSPFDTYMVGILMSKNGDLEGALSHISDAIQREPQNPLFHKWAANTLVKMNRIDDALQLLYAYRESYYYKAEKVIDGDGLPIRTQEIIDCAIKDTEEKKAKGYVYRSRKKAEQIETWKLWG